MMKRFLRWLGVRVHVFEYRNPYSRTCIHCGLCQDFYVRQWGTKSGGIEEYPIGWEVMYPLAHSPDKCRWQPHD